jgi:hypothetical protein
MAVKRGNHRSAKKPGDSPAEPRPNPAAARAARAANQMGTRLKGAIGADRERQLEFTDLIILSTWRGLDRESDAPKRDIADEYYMDCVSAYKADHPGCRLALFDVGAVLLEGIGKKLQVTWLFGRIEFDSTDARALIDRIDAMNDAAMEWWPDNEAGPTGNPDSGGRRRLGLFCRRDHRERTGPQRSPALQRQPHLARAYELATGVVSAAANEQTRHLEKKGRTEQSTDGGGTNGAAIADTVSDLYRRDLDEVSKRIGRAEALLEAAGQRTAQSLYARGMFQGILLLGLVTLVGGLVLWAFGGEARYAIGVPAGGLGAFVSVFQRMGRKGFKLDMDPGSELVRFGRVRPFIGAIFGLVIMALLESGVLSIPHTGSSLALYAALGFFAGFNERFAPDKLTSAALVESHPQTGTPRASAARG